MPQKKTTPCVHEVARVQGGRIFAKKGRDTAAMVKGETTAASANLGSSKQAYKDKCCKNGT
jgi:hypothetical protein